MIDDTSDRAEIYDLFNRYADGTAGRNYTATIDGDVAEASVRVRVYQMFAGDPSRLYQKILGAFRATLVRTWKGWRFRHFGAAQYAKLGAQELLPPGSRTSVQSSPESRSSAVGSGAGFPNRVHPGR